MDATFPWSEKLQGAPDERVKPSPNFNKKGRMENNKSAYL